MSRARPFPESIHLPGQPPEDVADLARWFEAHPASRDRFRWTLRDSVDELFDGQRTGNWCYQHLTKTERTHLGTVVEINLTKEFQIANGTTLDWNIEGRDLDCKFAKDLGSWSIPMEMYVCDDHGDRSGEADHPALLVWLRDDSKEWAVGLITITDDRLRWTIDRKTGEHRRSYNRDNKRTLTPSAVKEIYWLWGGLQKDLPENILLGLDQTVRSRIFSNSTSGQKRVNQLFFELQGRLVNRATVMTVAQQDDGMKRARDARLARNLGNHGILVLGHQEANPEIARLLRLPVPYKGEFVSVRVVRVVEADPRPKVYLDGDWWSIATPDEASEPAPDVPRKQLGNQPDIELV